MADDRGRNPLDNVIGGIDHVRLSASEVHGVYAGLERADRLHDRPGLEDSRGEGFGHLFQ